jgi:predicted Zn-dependent protease
LLTLGLLALLVVLGTVLGHGSSQAAGPAHGLRHVTVQSGETLWTLAARIDPQQDPRLVVAKLQAANRLTGATVYAGEQLLVPPIG